MQPLEIEYDERLTMIKKKKLWFGHVSKSSGLAKKILKGSVKGKGMSYTKKGRKIILKSGQGWTLPAQLEQLTNKVERVSVVPPQPCKIME